MPFCLIPYSAPVSTLQARFGGAVLPKGSGGTGRAYPSALLACKGLLKFTSYNGKEKRNYGDYGGYIGVI